MFRSLTAPVVAIALLLGGSAGARAALIAPGDLQWQYNFSPTMTPPAVFAVNPGASVTFTNEQDKFATGSSDIVATNLRVSSVATASNPDTLGAGAAYGLVLKLSVPDQLTMGPPITGTLTFGGMLHGTFSGESSNVANVFTDSGPKELEIGGYLFTVTLTSYTPPGPPNQVNSGSISAHVDVSLANVPTDPTDPTPVPQDVPEPGSLALCGLGALLGGAAWWRRRRKLIEA